MSAQAGVPSLLCTMHRLLKKHLSSLLFIFLVGIISSQAAKPLSAVEAPTVIRIAFSGTGIGGRPQVEGSYIATAHARGMLEEEFRKDNIQIQWYFFKGAGPATNEAFANHQIDFA